MINPLYLKSRVSGEYPFFPRFYPRPSASSSATCEPCGGFSCQPHILYIVMREKTVFQGNKEIQGKAFVSTFTTGHSPQLTELLPQLPKVLSRHEDSEATSRRRVLDGAPPTHTGRWHEAPSTPWEAGLQAYKLFSPTRTVSRAHSPVDHWNVPSGSSLLRLGHDRKPAMLVGISPLFSSNMTLMESGAVRDATCCKSHSANLRRPTRDGERGTRSTCKRVSLLGKPDRETAPGVTRQLLSGQPFPPECGTVHSPDSRSHICPFRVHALLLPSSPSVNCGK